MRTSIWITAAAIYCFAMGALPIASLSRNVGVLRNPTYPVGVFGVVVFDVSTLLWVVLTGIGLLRRWRWSRLSIQVLALLLVYTGVFTAVNVGTLGLKTVLFNSVQTFVGIACLVVFNLQRMKVACTPQAGSVR
jgi:hypothetical protein